MSDLKIDFTGLVEELSDKVKDVIDRLINDKEEDKIRNNRVEVCFSGVDLDKIYLDKSEIPRVGDVLLGMCKSQRGIAKSYSYYETRKFHKSDVKVLSVTKSYYGFGSESYANENHNLTLESVILEVKLDDQI